jgi:hypothetical protein
MNANSALALHMQGLTTYEKGTPGGTVVIITCALGSAACKKLRL